MNKETTDIKSILQKYSKSELIEFIMKTVAREHSVAAIAEFLGEIRLTKIGKRIIEKIRQGNEIDSKLRMFEKAYGHKNCWQTKSLLAKLKKNDAEFDRLNKEYNELSAEIYGSDDCD